MTFSISCPLLARELAERAARKRTYVVRVVYAILLFGFFGLAAYVTMQFLPRNAFGWMGAGRDLLVALIYLQFIGIYLFLPAMMCGVITSEKERGSFALLLLTRLSPTQILLQKFLSGLIPMGTFLVLSLPLGAFAYSLGGIGTSQLAVCAGVLVETCLQVGALALLCSVWFRSSATAFIATYLFGALFYWLVIIGAALITGSDWGSIRYSPGIEVLFPPYLFAHFMFSGKSVDPIDFIRGSTLIVASVAIFLVLARYWLVRRAFSPGKNWFLALFRFLDRVAHRANRLVGNITIRSRDQSLPDTAAVSWIESRQRVLGRPHYIMRIGVALELLAVFAALLAMLSYNSEEGVRDLLFFFGVIVLLILTVQGANIFATERVNQTLEILLTTPLSASEILRQKMQVQRRLFLVLLVPLLTLTGIIVWARFDDVWHNTHSIRNATYYLLQATITFGIWFPLTSWIAAWIGMKSRTRFKAILVSIGVITGWCLIPLGAIVILRVSGHWHSSTADMGISGLSHPFALVDSPAQSLDWLPACLGGLIYAEILLVVRRHCYRNADRFLRR